MKKMFVIFLMTVLLVGVVLAVENSQQNKNIKVLIEHKNPIKQSTGIFSILNSKKSIVKKYETKTISKEEFELLKNDDSILIQENIPRHIFLDTSTSLINANKTWKTQENLTNITGMGQVVCILDTGAQTNHPALSGKNATCNIDCLTNPGVCVEDCSKTDTVGHGTHVAGIIASSDSTYHGVTIDTKYIPLIVCDAASCNDAAIQGAMDWCITNKTIFNISVISMSLGTDSTYQTYCDASFAVDSQKINLATQNNISVVVATGNGANLTGISSPACITNSIRVGNSYDADVGRLTWGNNTCTDTTTFVDKIVCHTNRNSFFSDMLLAPGALITSTWNNLSFNTIGGTSMSTPQVSAIITLINQYKKLESNVTLTPSEIKTILIDSGKQLNDTNGTNLNYSRVNAYQAILYSDEQTPNITYMSPLNNSLNDPTNTSFTCNATDNLQFANLTIKIYNSTSLVYNTSSSSESLTSNYTLTEGNYNWSCTATDNQSNTEIRTNFLTASSILSSITPINNTYTNNNNTNFNCSAQSTKNLSNVTFNIYENNSLIYNITNNLTGTINYSLFNYNFTNETSYLYNCLAINNLSQSSLTQNYTITYDVTSPQINLTTPVNNTTTSSPITFTYNETETNKDSCNLTINNITKSLFIQNLANANYNWSVTCTDLANNTNTSETRILTIYTAPAPTQSSGGGGGGSSNSIKTYNVKDSELKAGYTKKLKTKDIIRFNSKSNSHKLTLNKINTNKVEITIESKPINVTLYLNSKQKINLDNDKTFDLEVTLLSIISQYANIEIKEINETVPVKHIFVTKPIINETNKTEENKTTTEINNKTKRNKLLENIILLFQKIITFFNHLF